MSEPRPAHFPPGLHVGASYVVEGLVRLAEGRMFYLANDSRAEGPTRRFLLSARWRSAHFEAWEAFVARGLSHPGLAPPVDVFRHEKQLVSALPYQGEGLMLDEAAPLPNARVLGLAQRLAGTLAYLHLNGVRLAALSRSNLLIAPDNTVRLYDLDVAPAVDGPVPPELAAKDIAALAELLRRYVDVESKALADLFAEAFRGAYADLPGFGRAVEQAFPEWAPRVYPAVHAAMTDVGLTRQLNEDNWGWVRLSDRANLYVVADGMGGHDGGEVASALAVDTICKVALEAEQLHPDGHDAVQKMLDDAFQAANNNIKEQAEAKGTDMGTTLVSMLLLDGRYAFLANVGDSRAYLMRSGALHQVTEDHSLVAKMVERGRITAEEARTHPHSNILLRTVGTERDVEIDLFRVELEPGDRVLMCSDGLWGEVEDRDMEAILNTYGDPRIAARELVRASHHGGGKDNVTLMLVEVPLDRSTPTVATGE